MQSNVLQAMLHCNYKAWLLAKENQQPELIIFEGNQIIFPYPNISLRDKTIITAWYISNTKKKHQNDILEVKYGKEQKLPLRLKTYRIKALKLLENANSVINQIKSPVF